ncbi:PREDICTED: vomeronasal type-1 receptor 1-like [Galeopterus variegatus]|uniref:Vomeronasal type-1 receptor n=1 Tax=Galeopterus variegatus TaxID=482537 RepID=A0ABM0SJS7_GALVR|nr:PREDICTED: vomeronasal type-1 receptor 1-like [Galeopterus variegatus]
MDAGKLELGIIFLIQTGVGILGNSSLLCLYNFSLLTGYKWRPTDVILSQLVLANSLVLFSKGIPQTMAAFGLKNFLNSAGCKVVFYYYRVGTGVSFSNICLLNGFQAIMLNPSICRRMEHKIRSPKFIGFCCSLCWVLQLLINSCVPILVNRSLNSENFTVKKSHGYCSWIMPEKFSSLYTVIYFSPGFVTLGFMIWASGSMVIFLHKHKQRVQYIHSNSLSKPRRSYEARATYTILILTSSFFTFNSIYTILTVWMTLVANPGQWMVNSSVLVASCFPTFSPFLLIVNDSRVFKFCFACRAR